MTEHAPDRIWSGIDIPKTIAGVLAALSAAVIGSFLGVAGTLAGAAVASLIGSVGTEIYQRSIQRGHQKLVGTFTAAPAAVGTPPVAAAADTTVALPAMDASPKKIRWKRVALVAGALFVLALGTLTVAELISGKSIADATRGGTGDRSTISSILGDDSGKSDKSDKSTPTPSESASPSATSTDQPGQQATTEAPTPSGNATSPAPASTEAPATDAPTQNPTGTSGGDAGGGTGSGTGSGSGGGSGSGSGSGSGIAPQKGADTQNPDNGTE
ncbi:hypothetical protein ACQP2F_36910 [Actinoplanes sp. CA-030573]|uniref:hypothetical protein n=1 Tax=Actinoplanes sp. CA-030573 TaxID=3239898 RepID=UPI003D8D1F42